MSLVCFKSLTPKVDIWLRAAHPFTPASPGAGLHIPSHRPHLAWGCTSRHTGLTWRGAAHPVTPASPGSGLHVGNDVSPEERRRRVPVDEEHRGALSRPPRAAARVHVAHARVEHVHVASVPPHHVIRRLRLSGTSARPAAQLAVTHTTHALRCVRAAGVPQTLCCARLADGRTYRRVQHVGDQTALLGTRFFLVCRLNFMLFAQHSFLRGSRVVDLRTESFEK